MKTFKNLLWAVLCLAICMGLAVPAMAANENNNRGVTFSAALDRASIEESAAEQLVTMTLSASKPVTMDGLGFTVTWEGPIVFRSVQENIQSFAFDEGGTNYENGKVGGRSSNSANISGVTELAVITFAVPANTPAGTYRVGVEEIEVTDNYGTIWENAASTSTVLNISESTADPTVSGYRAGLTTTTPSVTVGETVSVSVAVNHGEDGTFHAGELVFAYDPAYLTFRQEDSRLGKATVKDDDGTLTLEDYGAAKNCGSGIYTLIFDAVAHGDVQIALTKAAFSDEKNAASRDLTESICDPEEVSIQIQKKRYPVVLPEGMTGGETAEEGGKYTFSIADQNYHYSNVTATVDGQTVPVTDNGDGTYTISGVSGELKITATRAPKSYTVTFAGTAASDITGANKTAAYGTDYRFTIPSRSGWTYTLGGVTIGGSSYTGYGVANSVCTIPGAAITGNLVITVNKNQYSASVTVTGSGAGAVQGYAASAEVGKAYTLTLKPESGYDYTVTASMDGKTAELKQNGNQYTIDKVTGDIAFTVERTVDVSGVSVSAYVSVDGGKVWLVRNTVTPEKGKVPAYDGKNMFWSDAYNAYCHLVIAPTLSAQEAKAAVSILEGTALVVDYGMDVNKTGTVDANDAQLTYNIYNASYDAFDGTVTMEKFLRSDVNRDGKVDTADGAAIIHKILNG